MELQHSVNTSTNFPPFLGTSGGRERLKRTAIALRDSSDLRQRPVSPNPAQPYEQAVAAPESAAKQPSIDKELTAQWATNDYSCATEDVLIAEAKSSNGRAFEELSGRHLRSIRRTVYRIVRNLEDTEDVLQDSLLKAYCSLPEFKESCKFSTWITKIAVNSALMLLRKRKARPEVSLIRSDAGDQTGKTWDIADPSSSIERRLATQEARDLLSRAVEMLPANYRNVLEQFHLQEKSMREAADTLGISIPTAKARLFRARRALRSRLIAIGLLPLTHARRPRQIYKSISIATLSGVNTVR
jgi:RNA polymerase sigma-70 factor (ECF subfamily)